MGEKRCFFALTYSTLSTSTRSLSAELELPCACSPRGVHQPVVKGGGCISRWSRESGASAGGKGRVVHQLVAKGGWCISRWQREGGASAGGQGREVHQLVDERGGRISWWLWGGEHEGKREIRRVTCSRGRLMLVGGMSNNDAGQGFEPR